MEIRRFLRLREQILANVCENGEAVSIKKEDPVLSFLNFADLAQYQDELSSDGVMLVDHIQDVERDDCFRYGKIKFSILYRVRGLTEW